MQRDPHAYLWDVREAAQALQKLPRAWTRPNIRPRP